MLGFCDGALLQSLLWGKSVYPPGYGIEIISKFCLYLFLTCVFAGMHVGFGGVHAVDYLCLNGLLCGQKCVIPVITVENTQLKYGKTANLSPV